MAAFALHHVQSRHHQARAVADDADVAFQTHISQAALVRFGFNRVVFLSFLELRHLFVAEQRVIVDNNFRIGGDESAVAGQNQRIDFGQRTIVIAVTFIEGFQKRGRCPLTTAVGNLASKASWRI